MVTLPLGTTTRRLSMQTIKKTRRLDCADFDDDEKQTEGNAGAKERNRTKKRKKHHVKRDYTTNGGAERSWALSRQTCLAYVALNMVVFVYRAF